MKKALLISYYQEETEYPTKYSLSTLRLGAYIKAQEELSEIELKILPLSQNESTEKQLEEVMTYQPNLIGLPAYMWTSNISQELSAAIRDKDANILTVVGGPDISTFDYDNWSEETLFVHGEGEEPLSWIIKKFLQGNDFTRMDINDIHPAVFSKIKTFPFRKTRLDKEPALGLPIYSNPVLELLTEQENIDKRFTWHDTAISCPYKCGYCGHKTREKVALRDDLIVEEEIKNIGRLGFEEVFIIDPILGGIPGRDKKVLKWYKEHAPLTRINAYYRPEYFDNRTIKLLSESNIKEILIGLQSTNPNVPSWLRGNNLTKVRRYLPLLSKNKIFSRIELITGLPGDTPEGMKESLRFVVEEIQPMSVRSYHLTTIPGTQLHTLLNADEKGEDLWVQCNPQNNRVTKSHSYSAKEMEEMLIFSGAITSLYNTLMIHGLNKIKDKPITFNQLEELVKREISSANQETINQFKTSDMEKAQSFWEKKI